MENLSPEMKSFLEKVGYFNATVIKSEDVNYTLEPYLMKSDKLHCSTMLNNEPMKQPKENNLANNDWVKFFEKSRLAAVKSDVKE
jgi:hypothetical protein